MDKKNDVAQGAAARGGWRRAVAALAMASAALLAGCGGGDDDLAAPVEASATIGPAGGTLDGPDGTQVVIPPQALTQDTLIRIARSSEGAPPADPQGYAPQATAYEFTPHDIVFERPVTIRIPVPAASDPSAPVDVFASSPTLPWYPVEATVEGGFGQWQSTSFSWFKPWPCAPLLNDPYPCVALRLTTFAETATTGALTKTSSDPFAGRTYKLTESATVRLTLRYQAARDCSDARLTVRRFKKINNVTTSQVLIDDQPVPLADKPGSSLVSEGSRAFDVAFTDADNGTAYFGSKVSCQRLFQKAGGPVYRQSDVDGLVIVVSAAPPVTAPPVITQQPANLAVNVGGSAAFTVAATAPDSLTLDWQRSNDAGATWTSVVFGGTGYAFVAAAVDAGARFRVRVCNVKGNLPPNCVFSAAAVLTVNGATGPGPLVVTAMATGFGSSLVVASDGTVWAWGEPFDDSTGGLKDDGPGAPLPVQVQGLSGVKAVAISADSGGAYYALHVDGTVSAWGPNTSGSLGDRTTTRRVLPVKVLQDATTPMDEVCSIVAGSGFLLMARETGCSPGQRVVASGPWIVGLLSGTTIGGNSSASAPLDGAIARLVPGWPVGQSVRTMAAPDAANSAGAAYFQTGSGDRYVWGANGSNLLGAGVSTAFAGGAGGPIAPPDGLFWSGIKRVELGRDFSMALDEGDFLLTAGRNVEGQLGIGSTVSSSTLLKVSTLGKVVDFSAGQTSAAAITNGEIWAWGWNGTMAVSAPVRVGTGTGFTRVVVGDIHSLAIGPGGELYSWGDPSYGALGRSGAPGTPTVVMRP